MTTAYQIFDEFLDGVFIFNENKEIVYCNEIAATIFGTRSKRTLGKKAYEIFKIENNALFCTENGTEGKDGASHYVEVQYTGKETQGLVQIMVRPCPIYPDQKHYLCYFHNVTEEQSLSSKYRTESEEKEKAHNLATTDAMTGLRNFRSFTLQIADEMKISVSDKESLGLVIVDVDKFKKFNDTYGHQQGDEVLKVVAKTLKDSVRKADFVARYGGEEFVVILPKTGIDGIKNVCEKMRANIEAAKVANLNDPANTLSVTASFGAICISYDFLKNNLGKEYKFFLEYADKNLYQAKEGGRNQSVVSDLV
jgi:diguanylate cyclase (GGDEF)-like protein/PAS domain S-box-containing protein